MACTRKMSIKLKSGTRRTVSCGKCSDCLEKRRAVWTFRLLQELRFAKSAYFVTLTYEDSFLPKDNNVEKKELQDFMKRLRRAQDIRMPYGLSEEKQKLWKKENQLRYYAVGEYGEKDGRPHYHIILFNLKREIITSVIDFIDKATGEMKIRCIELEKYWKKGLVNVGKVEQASIHYVTGYLCTNKEKKNVRPFSLMSKRPYLGSQYLDKNMIKHHKANMTSVSFLDDHKIAIPRIYKDKMYSKKEKTDSSNKMFSERQAEKRKLIRKHGYKKYRLRVESYEDYRRNFEAKYKPKQL